MESGFHFIYLIAWLGLCFVTAWVGSRFKPGDWYRQLQKPRWTPPGYLFGPVWTILYTAMGVAAWLVWRRADFSGAGPALFLFIGQLILNGIWSWLFFGRHNIGLALLEIIILWVMILATLIAFWIAYMPAGILLIPYLAWVSFAVLLNLSLWRLNKSR